MEDLEEVTGLEVVEVGVKQVVAQMLVEVVVHTVEEVELEDILKIMEDLEEMEAFGEVEVELPEVINPGCSLMEEVVEILVGVVHMVAMEVMVDGMKLQMVIMEQTLLAWD